MSRRIFLVAAVANVALALTVNTPLSAHKTAVSPYTFHRDVLPIIEARCGRCHGDSSASGLSLLRYDSARGATWLMRQQLVSNHMPPWFAEGSFKSHAPLTAGELNVLMTWATGGAPEGVAVAHEAATLPSWPLGLPDQIVTMPAPVTVSADQAEHVEDVRLDAARIGGRLIRAVDLLPGTATLVRRAEFIAKTGSREQVLGLWQPGESPVPIEGAFRVPAGAALTLRMHYRRRFGDAESDQSTVGIYLSKRGAPHIEAFDLTGDPGAPTRQRIEKTMRVVAIRPVAGPEGAHARLTVIGSDGTRRAVATIQLHKDWQRRYVFATPVTLAAGNTIEISVIPSEGQLWSNLTGEAVTAGGPLRLAIEFVN